MALSPGNPDTFIREVDDAVRADQLGSFFTRFGKPLLALVVVGLLAFAGYLFWQSRNADGDAALGGKFSTALDSLDQGRPKAASTAMEPIATGANPIYRALALISQGDAAMAQGDTATAAARFGLVAADSDVAQPLRDVATVRQTLAEYDTLQPATIVARLRALVAQPTNPAFPSAAELTALAELKRGNDRVAGQLYKRIAETAGVADSLKSRAVQMAGMLGVDAVAAPADGADAAPNSAARPAAATKTGE